MRIFITGLSGYVGSYLAEYFSRLDEVECITGISRSKPGATLPAKVSWAPMDIRSPDLISAMSGHDIVLHNAFIVHWTSGLPQKERIDINSRGIENVAKAAIASGVQQFIDCSSIAAYDVRKVAGQTDVTEEWPTGTGDSNLYYPDEKSRAEFRLVELIGPSRITLTIFRPSYIIGPHDQLVISGYRNKPFTFIGHNPRMQYIHEDDLGDAYLKAIEERLAGVFNLVPDDFTRWKDVLRIVGVKHPVPLPAWLGRFMMGVQWKLLNEKIHPDWMDIHFLDYTFSNAKLKSTGWKPRYSSDDALRSAIL